MNFSFQETKNRRFGFVLRLGDEVQMRVTKKSVLGGIYSVAYAAKLAAGNLTIRYYQTTIEPHKIDTERIEQLKRDEESEESGALFFHGLALLDFIAAVPTRSTGLALLGVGFVMAGNSCYRTATVHRTERLRLENEAKNRNAESKTVESVDHARDSCGRGE